MTLRSARIDPGSCNWTLTGISETSSKLCIQYFVFSFSSFIFIAYGRTGRKIICTVSLIYHSQRDLDLNLTIENILTRSWWYAYDSEVMIYDFSLNVFSNLSFFLQTDSLNPSVGIFGFFWMSKETSTRTITNTSRLRRWRSTRKDRAHIQETEEREVVIFTREAKSNREATSDQIIYSQFTHYEVVNPSIMSRKNNVDKYHVWSEKRALYIIFPVYWRIPDRDRKRQRSKMIRSALQKYDIEDYFQIRSFFALRSENIVRRLIQSGVTKRAKFAS